MSGLDADVEGEFVANTDAGVVDHLGHRQTVVVVADGAELCVELLVGGVYHKDNLKSGVGLLLQLGYNSLKITEIGVEKGYNNRYCWWLLALCGVATTTIGRNASIATSIVDNLCHKGHQGNQCNRQSPLSKIFCKPLNGGDK